jgi:hypothetical protein
MLRALAGERMHHLRVGNLKTLLGGLMMLAIGAFFFAGAFDYGIGTFRRMGPGFVPLVLGAILGLLGLALAGSSCTLGAARFRSEFPPLLPRFIIAVVASLSVFALTIERFGLVPAVVLTTAIAACGDREARWLGTLALVSTMALGTWLIFRVGLDLSLPPFRWRP